MDPVFVAVGYLVHDRFDSHAPVAGIDDKPSPLLVGWGLPSQLIAARTPSRGEFFPE